MELFVGEIRIFGFDFAPTGWATCDGQLLPINQNTALFSLIGTINGGDGSQTCADGGGRPGSFAWPGPTRSVAGSRPSIYRQRRGAAPPQPLAPEAVGPSGGGQPHNNMMPFVTLNFCIALQGNSPPRA